MNFNEVFEVALPELPVRRARARPPQLDPKLIAREHVEGTERTVLVLPPGSTGFFRLDPDQWRLLQLFDGVRSYEEVADLYRQETGTAIDADSVRRFAEDLGENSPFWYRTAQEKNIALSQKLKDERLKRVKKESKFADLSHIEFSAVDPDKLFTKLYAKLKFVYSRWFIALNLALFGFMTYVFVDRFEEIGRDTLKFYHFTDKGIGELALFWTLLLVLTFLHEVAHGLTCKHTGGEVHKLGFLLIYLTPCFFCDITQAWVYGSKWQRIGTAVAGMWTEMICCSLATIVWWGTPPGTTAHELSYTIMLITGVAVLVLNLNPLIKLDGYFILTEMIGIPELKERSTAYVSGWVKKNIFRIAVDLEYVPVRRRFLYVPYALLSGVYSYGLLFAVVRFVYNVARNYSPEWAFVPATGLAWVIFKSRIRTLWRFMKSVYLDKRERTLAWFTPVRTAVLLVFVALMLFAPLRRETVSGMFQLEPVQRAVLRTQVPGRVSQVLVHEGEWVANGTPVVVLRNLTLESEAGRAHADFAMARARATAAQLRYAGYGPADQERRELAERSRLLQEQIAHLTISSPIAGTVATPHIQDLLDSELEAGATVAEVVDVSQLRARIYVPETEVRKIHVGSPVSLRVNPVSRTSSGTVLLIAPVPTEIAQGLVDKQNYAGMRPPQYYAATALVPNESGLKDGMSGEAKIFSRRRSLAALGWETVYEFAGRKFW